MNSPSVFDKTTITTIMGNMGIRKLEKRLEVLGFFEKPASRKHHLNCPGGLARHSLNVYRIMKDLDMIMNDRHACNGTPTFYEMFLAAICHDLEKCEDNPGRNYDGPYHAQRGVEIATELFFDCLNKLPEKVSHAIRWHMGLYSGEPVHEVSDAFAYNQLAFMLHTADVIASRVEPVYEKEAVNQ